MNPAPVANASVALAYAMVGVLVVFLGIIILREAPRERANRATAFMLFSGGMGSVLGAIGFIIDILSLGLGVR